MSSTLVQLDGRELKLTNLEKVLYPSCGYTKADVIDYYLRVSPYLLPHLHDRPLTLHRFPNGVDSSSFYEKNCPSHRPDWVRTATVQSSRKTICQCLADDASTLVWMANLASLEIHPTLGTWQDIHTPTKLTFDLDPGAPATIVECCRVALELRDLFEAFGLRCFPKTSGSKGMQIELPLNTPTSYDKTKPFALAVATLLESRDKKLVVSEMDKSLRKGKVFIDWSQNVHFKTTVSVYSLRARERPWISTPLTWDEIQAAADEPSGAQPLRFEAAEVFERLDRWGDLSADVITLQQELPPLGS